MNTTKNTIRLGLRVDVDTFRGTRDGVPKLLNLFAQNDINASIFFSVGPDNMGRHLWRLIKPAFLMKMLRSRAVRLYGWDILLKGTFWPGPIIGKRCGGIIRKAAKSGHEIGLHAWDHHYWQNKLEVMSRKEIQKQLSLGFESLCKILNCETLTCSAVAGWKCNDTVLLEKNKLGFRYSSDCRGTSIFTPLIDNHIMSPQIPVTLPTYDEVIGRNGITDENYNDYIFSLIKPGRLNVLTIHAEVEGIARNSLFVSFLESAKDKRIEFVPLGQLLPPDGDDIPGGKIELKAIQGREGTVCWQSAGNLI